MTLIQIQKYKILLKRSFLKEKSSGKKTFERKSLKEGGTTFAMREYYFVKEGSIIITSGRNLGVHSVCLQVAPQGVKNVSRPLSALARALNEHPQQPPHPAASLPPAVSSRNGAGSACSSPNSRHSIADILNSPSAYTASQFFLFLLWD